MPKALLIEPHTREIKEVEIDGYKGMLPFLPGGITFGGDTACGDVLYVDEEALLRPITCAFRWKALDVEQPYVSRGLLVGRETRNPEKQETVTLDVMTSIQELRERVEWMTVDQALQWFANNGNEPAVSLTNSFGTTVLATNRDFLATMQPEA